jgi:Methyltransferase FkbM domain
MMDNSDSDRVPIPTLDDYAMQLEVARVWDAEIAKPRHADPKRLLRYGFKIYSQNDEDGIIQEIFRRIGVTARTFVEFGVATGSECNTVKLLIEGWRGLWMEADPLRANSIRRTFDLFCQDDKLVVLEKRVTAENIDALLSEHAAVGEIDLLSIDIDYNDYWIWKAISSVRPRVVVIEYNASLRPPLALTVPYDPQGSWDGSNFYGASVEALVRLGAEKGYRIVGCSLAGVNAFFVRADLCADKFLEPATAEEHYEPPRHYFHLLPSGHKPRPGRFVAV